MNHFQATAGNRYHLSVGAVVRNEEGKICCHYFKSKFFSEVDRTLEDFYILMRETVEPGESLEECLARGLKEEFGVTARLESYLGSIVSHFPKESMDVEKTTLYFSCAFISRDDTLRSHDDIESGSETRWVEPSLLMSKMKEQSARLNREDTDESIMIERALEKMAAK